VIEVAWVTEITWITVCEMISIQFLVISYRRGNKGGKGSMGNRDAHHVHDCRLTVYRQYLKLLHE